MGFIGFILLLILLVTVFRQSARVDGLEKRLSRLEKGEKRTIETEKPVAVGDPSIVAEVNKLKEQGLTTGEIKNYLLSNGWSFEEIENILTSESVALKQIPVGSPDQEPIWSERLFDWLKEGWMLKAGAVLLLAGFGWLTTYAFLNNWIGPAGRIALGFGAGFLFLLIG
ncbi:MAG: hypothetical protein ACOCU8_03230 [Patescibacteria group bacterium]